MSSVMSVNRRSFLKTGAAVGSGLVLGFKLPIKGQAQTAGPLTLNAFVKVGTDDTVTLEIHKSEMGQGVVTGLSQLLAEELECDWKKIRTEFPGVAPVYGAPMMGAYGSLSIRTLVAASCARRGPPLAKCWCRQPPSSGGSTNRSAGPRTTRWSIP